MTGVPGTGKYFVKSLLSGNILKQTILEKTNVEPPNHAHFQDEGSVNRSHLYLIIIRVWLIAGPDINSKLEVVHDSRKGFNEDLNHRF